MTIKLPSFFTWTKFTITLSRRIPNLLSVSVTTVLFMYLNNDLEIVPSPASDFALSTKKRRIAWKLSGRNFLSVLLKVKIFFPETR